MGFTLRLILLTHHRHLFHTLSLLLFFVYISLTHFLFVRTCLCAGQFYFNFKARFHEIQLSIFLILKYTVSTTGFPLRSNFVMRKSIKFLWHGLIFMYPCCLLLILCSSGLHKNIFSVFFHYLGRLSLKLVYT